MEINFFVGKAKIVKKSEKSGTRRKGVKVPDEK
jgi:hypothetical protein